MRFEHQGLSLWYGTPDAPAPALALRFGADAWVTVAVQPASASNRVEVDVRVNGGPTETVGAKWLRDDDRTGAQYFRAHIPRLRAGDVVEYTPICRCDGLQVPSPEEASGFLSSFQVVAAEMRETVVKLQRQLGVDATGELDEVTVAAFEARWRGEGLTVVEVVVEEPPSVGRGGGGGGSAPGGDRANEGVVHGKFVDQDGAPIPRTRVVAYRQKLRAETALGQATTHGTGQYRITYRRTTPPNLVVRAYDETGTVIAQSSTAFNAAADVEVDLTTAADGVVRDPSRFTALLAEVTAQLHGTLLADLVESRSTHEVQFVAQATGEPFNDVARLYIADKLGKRDGLRDETLFGLFSQGIPAALDGALGSLPDAGIDDAFLGQVMSNVLAQTRDVLSGALGDALSENTIPTSYGALQGGELSKLDALRAQSAGSAPQPIATAPTPAQQTVAQTFTPVITLAGLTGAAAGAVANAVMATPVIDDAVITNLVTSNAITALQGKALGFSIALYALTDRSSALAMAIQSTFFPQLGAKPPASTADLAKLGPADWTAFLTTSKVALPAGATPQTAGVALAGRFAALEPNAALFGRLPPVPANAAVAQLQPLANAYPGLGIAAILADPKTDAATKAKTVTRLVGLVQQVGAQIGTMRLMLLDLSQGSADIAKLGLDKIGATTDEQAMVLETLKSYQREWAVSRDVDLMVTVVGAGFTSAHAIAEQPVGTAVATLGAAGVDTPMATWIWGQARAAMADVGLHTGAVIHATHGVRLGPIDNLASSALAYLQQLPGYEQLFGSLSFCDCEECQSIIGPAAYFVDLMRYIDTNLRNQFATSGNPLDLLVRRPDLWTLELSCDNTNTVVPTLDIVDQVLENYIGLQIQPGIPEPLVTPSTPPPNADRSQVQTLVYETTLAQGASSTLAEKGGGDAAEIPAGRPSLSCERRPRCGGAW